MEGTNCRHLVGVLPGDRAWNLETSMWALFDLQLTLEEHEFELQDPLICGL